MKKPKQAFATDKKWDSTLKQSAQMRNVIGRTSQNKIKAAKEMLMRGMQGKKK